MFVFLGVCALVTVVASAEIADTAGFVGVFVGTASSGWLFIQRSRLFSGREQLGWSLIGAGLLIASGGVISIAIRFLMVGDAPTFGFNDLFFFATYATIIAGFAVLPHTQGSPLQRTRMVIDGLIGAIFIGALLWVYVLSPLMVHLESAPTTTRVIGALYPFLDLVFLTVAMLVLLRRSTRRFDTRLALFTVGVVAQVVGDVLFLVSARTGSFEAATPPYVVNLVGIAAFFASAYLLRSAPPVREYAERTAPLWTVVAPYVPAVGLLGVFIVDWIMTSRVDHVLLI
ncbi:MAG: hypothetical protein M3094_03315, partial [Actinomycetia bacterium]|nr:hypothetical protein [Actinomycetes bacterium]